MTDKKTGVGSIERAIIVEDQPNHKIKLIHKVLGDNDIVISTYKTNS